MEEYFLNTGMSWTVSKVLPYLIMVVLGVVLLLVSKRIFKSSKIPIRWGVNTISFLLPFLIYFALNPIYQGDFTNNAIEVSRSDVNKELSGKKLVVLSIKGCPFCYEAIDQLLTMKKRVPDLEIEYVVCKGDSSSVDWYQKKGGDQISVRLAENKEEMQKLANYVYPTFVLVDGDDDLKTWSNDSFGVFAKDEVELEFD